VPPRCGRGEIRGFLREALLFPGGVERSSAFPSPHRSSALQVCTVEDEHHRDVYMATPRESLDTSRPAAAYSGVSLKLRQVKVRCRSSAYAADETIQGAPAEVKYDSGNNEPKRGEHVGGEVADETA
jgi:hypothetical protein